MAQKLGIGHIIVPSSAGVGSAVGFLVAPLAYELVRSRHVRLGELDTSVIQALLSDMQAEAMAVVGPAARGAALEVSRTADVRYVGQGHEITVPLPDGEVNAEFVGAMRQRFAALYERLYSRSIPSLDIEVLSWAVRVGERLPDPERCHAPRTNGTRPPVLASREIFDTASEQWLSASVVDRQSFEAGMSLPGPALIVEDETTTLVTPGFVAMVNALGHIELSADRSAQKGAHA
jgi:N-methylhydantoinase A